MVPLFRAARTQREETPTLELLHAPPKRTSSDGAAFEEVIPPSVKRPEQPALATFAGARCPAPTPVEPRLAFHGESDNVAAAQPAQPGLFSCFP